jgi:hypothetical protein
LLCVRFVRRKKGRGQGKEKKKERKKKKEGKRGKKEGNRNLENLSNRKFMRISKIKYKELVQKLILYKRKK